MEKNNLKKLREEIDLIDKEIGKQIQQRFKVVEKLSEIKKIKNIPITDYKREEEIINKLTKEYNHIDKNILKEIYQTIFGYSKKIQIEKNKQQDIFKELKNKPIMIAGPCSVESEEQIVKISNYLKTKGIKFIRGGIYKPRTNPDAFQGHGIDALDYFRKIANKNKQFIVSEIMTKQQLDLAYEFIDIIQIGTRNMASFGFLKEVGKKTAKDQKPILFKRGMNATIPEFLNAAKYLTKYGNKNVILCLRGIRTFEQIKSSMRNTPDLASILELKKSSNLPVIFDSSHACGNTDYITETSKAALTLGADGVMIEVHNNPKKALSDGYQSLNFKQFNILLKKITNS